MPAVVLHVEKDQKFTGIKQKNKVMDHHDFLHNGLCKFYIKERISTKEMIKKHFHIYVCLKAEGEEGMCS